ncbi:MAG: hypothetical protein WDN75_14300 [Bacteroidota bacterium]
MPDTGYRMPGELPRAKSDQLGTASDTLLASGRKSLRPPGNQYPATGLRCIIVALILSSASVFAQSTNAPLNEEYYHKIDRYEIKSGRIVNELFTTVKPYKRSAIAAMMDSLQQKENIFQSRSDQFNLEYFRNDNWEWSRPETNDSKRPVLKKFLQKEIRPVFRRQAGVRPAC